MRFKTTRELTWASALTLLVTLTLSGCGGASGVSTTPPPPLAITSSAPPNGSVQTAYGGAGTGFSLAASGGIAPYTWTWTAAPGSALPSGLSLSTAGQISGTPTAAGTYNVAVTVADSESPPARTSANYSILIVAAGQLVITSGAPPNGTVNQTYGGSHTITQNNCSLTFSGWPLEAAGGTAGYHWSWAPAPGSSLPPGLAVSVASNTCGGSTRCCATVSATVIGGTPTAAGTYHVIVTVTDSASPPAQASANYTITIAGAAAAAAAKATAEVPSAQQHAHYKLIDLGTFGGPFSLVNTEPTENFINHSGTVVGGADTSLFTPVAGCYNPVNLNDCYISHAFAWRNEHLTDLGTLPGGSFSYAEGINNSGQIVGVSENGRSDRAFGFPLFHAVLWENGVIKDLGTLGGMSSFATTINNRGQIMGVALNDVPDLFSILGFGSQTTLTQTRGFLWQKGAMSDLGSLGGPDTFAIFLNQRGQVAGMSDTSGIPDPITGFPPMDAFLWENGKMKDLGNLGGTNPFGLFSGFVSGLNDRGEVTGTMTTPGDQASRAFLWSGEKLTDLGTFAGGSFAVSYGLNEAGDVVGLAGMPGDQTFHAFLWRNGVMIDLGTVDGDACSTAQNVNAAGQVVGSSQASDGMGSCVNPFTHAFLWENGGPSVDLNELIPPGSPLQVTVASYISDSGEIVAGGDPVGCTNNDACNHVALLIPCDKNHPGIEGCDYTPVDASAVGPLASPVPVAQRPPDPNAKFPIATPMLRALRNRSIPSYRGPGAQTPR